MAVATDRVLVFFSATELLPEMEVTEHEVEGVSFLDLAASGRRPESASAGLDGAFNFRKEVRLDCLGFEALGCSETFCLRPLA